MLRINTSARITAEVLLFSLLSACSMRDGEPEEAPYVRGPIQQMDHRATASGLLVLAGPGSIEMCGIQATVDASTVYERREASGELQATTLADLSVGDTVEVFVEGPIAESCPVQGRASRIVEVGRIE